MALSQEYRRHHPRPPKVEPRVLPRWSTFVVLPLVLATVAGCAMSPGSLLCGLAGLLFVHLCYFAAAAALGTSYYVIYSKTPVWLVGETAAQAYSRRPLADASVISQRYPKDHSGRIHELIPITKGPPTWCGEHVAYAEMSLIRSEFDACNRNEVKVDFQASPKLVSATIEDRFGATLAGLRAEFTDGEILDAVAAEKPNLQQEQVVDLVRSLRRDLPKTITSTGTGLYWVQTAPTNESEVQSGAPVGQVVTIVGTVTADIFTGGYITNTTQAETRAIVSHTTTTATLEGNLGSWGDTDVLEFYSAWTTVQAAINQQVTDQGTAVFTSTQVTEIYDGTYTEDVDGDKNFNPVPEYRWIIRAASGETAVVVTNVGLSTHTFDINDQEGVQFQGFQITSVLNSKNQIQGHYSENLLGRDMVFTGSGNHYGVYCTRQSVWFDCDWSASPTQNVVGTCKLFNCILSGALSVDIIGRGVQIVVQCVFDTCTKAFEYEDIQSEPLSPQLVQVMNCTFYDCTTVFNCVSAAGLRRISLGVKNSIFHTSTTVYDVGAAGGVLEMANCDYNHYFNVTNVAELGGSTYNFAQWQALTDDFGFSPDPNSSTADPLMTNPGASDFSLQSNSPCLHAGIGGLYMVDQEGINGVVCDKWHPDIGAWSSGIGPGRAVGSVG